MDPSYNNSFGSFSSGGGQAPQPIMSPVGGDIMLPAQPVKKKKVGLIIGVILILIAIGAGVAAAMLMGKGGSEMTARQAFNNFSNYFLYGVEDNADITDEYVWGKTYYMQSVFDGDIENLSDAPEILENLKNKYILAYQMNTDELEDYDQLFRNYYNTSLKKYEESMNDDGTNNISLEYLKFSDIDSIESTSMFLYYGELDVYEDIWEIKETVYEKEV